MNNGQVQFESGAVRSDDAEQVDYTLISPIGLRAWAEACREGAVKYSPYNCEKGMPARDLLNHALKHIYTFLEGDRSEPHLGHAIWNLGMAAHSLAMWPHLNGDLRREGCLPPNVTDEEAWAWKGLAPVSGGSEWAVPDPKQVDSSRPGPRRFYFAAQSPRAAELRNYRNDLEWGEGTPTVTSRWIDGGRPYHCAGFPSDVPASGPDAEAIRADWEDFNRADAVVLFTDNHLHPEDFHFRTCQRLEKELIVIGPIGRIFDPSSPGGWYPGWASFMQSINREESDARTSMSTDR